MRVQDFPRLGVIAGLHVAATVALVRGDGVAAGGLWLRALQLIDGARDGYLAANIYAGLSRSATLAGRYDEDTRAARHKRAVTSAVR